MADAPEEVSAHITSLHVPLSWFPQPYPPNVFLIRDGGHAALVDAGFSDDESFEKRMDMLKELGEPKVDYIFITHHHFDHSSGAHRLREALDAKIVVHEAEETLLLNPTEESGDVEIPEDQKEWRERAKKFRDDAAKAVPDVRVKDGETIEVGSLHMRCVHAPGHTAGHLCLVLQEDNVLFSGDNVLGVGTAAIAPPPHGDMAEYVRSLHKMQALETAMMACGHGPGVKEPHRKLQELIDHRQQREDQIVGLLGQGKTDVKSLVKAIYPELDKRLKGMATGQVVSHLHKLQFDGRVKLDGKGEDTTITPTAL
jgi:glyoxylase-like metal-dependent hydrolase (beta-lactamase superfamily II)